MQHLWKKQFWFGFNATALVLTAGFLLLIPIAQGYKDFTRTVDMRLTPYGTSTTALHLENPNNTPLNALEFELFFDPKTNNVTKVTLTQALCEERFVITSSIDTEIGRIFIQCGTVTPFTQATGTVALIESTDMQFRFGSTTHVLAHDGFGTDATRDLLY